MGQAGGRGPDTEHRRPAPAADPGSGTEEGAVPGILEGLTALPDGLDPAEQLDWVDEQMNRLTVKVEMRGLDEDLRARLWRWSEPVLASEDREQPDRPSRPVIGPALRRAQRAVMVLARSADLTDEALAVLYRASTSPTHYGMIRAVVDSPSADDGFRDRIVGPGAAGAVGRGPTGPVLAALLEVSDLRGRGERRQRWLDGVLAAGVPIAVHRPLYLRLLRGAEPARYGRLIEAIARRWPDEVMELVEDAQHRGKNGIRRRHLRPVLARGSEAARQRALRWLGRHRGRRRPG